MNEWHGFERVEKVVMRYISSLKTRQQCRPENSSSTIRTILVQTSWKRSVHSDIVVSSILFKLPKRWKIYWSARSSRTPERSHMTWIRYIPTLYSGMDEANKAEAKSKADGQRRLGFAWLYFGVVNL